MKMEVTVATLCDVFSWGVDYGQLCMEEERDGEDLFDAFQCSIIDGRCSMPAAPAPRRQPRSEAWRSEKRKSLERLFALINSKFKIQHSKFQKT